MIYQSIINNVASEVTTFHAETVILMSPKRLKGASKEKRINKIGFILDKSGSMGGLENDIIGGFNSMLEKQKSVDGECRITTVLFDNNYEIFHDRIDIKEVPKMNIQ